MVSARWRHRVRLPSILIGTAVVVTAMTATAAFAVSARPSAPPPIACPATPIEAARAASSRTDRQARVLIGDRISRRGEFDGRLLQHEQALGFITSISLPRDSFIGQRTGDLIVYTRFDAGRGSEVHLVNLSTGCDTVVARPAEVVRSAALSPDGSAVYVHAVRRGDRSDAGVTRHDLATGGQALAVPALSPPARIGRIFGTQLAWSLGGTSLAVHSCGFAECLTRVLSVSSGLVETVDAAGIGALVGATDSKVVAYGSCPGLPCSVVVHDIATGDRQLLSGHVNDAAMRLLPDGSAVVSMMTDEGSVEVSL